MTRATLAAEADTERDVLRLLASGRLREARRQAAAGPPGLVREVATADARARSLAADLPELQAVLERVEAAEGPAGRLRYWGYALVAERLLLDADPDALVVATHALDALDREDLPTLPPLALRYARARLRRVRSAAWLLVTGAERDALRNLLHQSVTELLACGFVGEVHATRGLAAGLAASSCEDIVENYADLVDARLSLTPDDESVWPLVLDSMVATLAVEVGDPAGAVAACERIERAPLRYRRLDASAAFARAILRLLAAGPGPDEVAGVEAAAVALRRHDPRGAQAFHGNAAGVLVDLGSPAAGHFARLEAEMPVVNDAHRVERRLLAVRLRWLAGAPASADQVVPLLERLAATGNDRQAGRTALRLAHDLTRAGAAGGEADGAALGDAERLHAWGLARVPPPPAATARELWWARPLAAAGEPPLLEVPGLPFPSLSVPDDGVRLPAPAAAGRARPGTGGPPRAAEDTLGLVPASHRSSASATAAGAAAPPRAPADAAFPQAPTVTLTLLAPTVVVRVEGRRARVSHTQAKLLAALAVAHPAPLHVEQASDVLWPDEPLEATRGRLNSLVRRLRRALGRHGSAVVREDALVGLDTEHCDTDLWRFRRGLSGTTGERIEALAAVHGNLCEAQFPYDERLVAERHRLVADWVRHARLVVQAGHVAPTDLGPALAALGLDPDDLA